MKRNQIEILQRKGEDLLEYATTLTKAPQVQSVTELGLRCFAEARAIFDALASNSAMVFIECCTYLGKSPNSYPAYLEFCARNGLEIFSKFDFDALVSDIQTQAAQRL